MCAKFFLTVKKRRKVKKVSEIWAFYGTYFFGFSLNSCSGTFLQILIVKKGQGLNSDGYLHMNHIRIGRIIFHWSGWIQGLRLLFKLRNMKYRNHVNKRHGTGTGYLPLDRGLRILVQMDYLLTCGSEYTDQFLVILLEYWTPTKNLR